jgi:hypothetical protein
MFEWVCSRLLLLLSKKWDNRGMVKEKRARRFPSGGGCSGTPDVFPAGVRKKERDGALLKQARR